ncbi:AraC family transcriptional regulator [Sulfurimonas sp. HSL-3221]|uniref:AraC family transcriptional regulator n=1 Tax=Thiomicrolovo sulfuroxydans TaxID=2894755 RepID=UPI001E565D82|nr:AraC family transcriptional regulator [Sulfurimonas sp. HSL-3221]UFS61860.1 AraC family transcriptional regulator [Sulfurimonas sp. HSL-3221]
MKKETLRHHAHVVNDALYYIYRHIDSPITLEVLAERNRTSVYHFHRIFKEVTGRNFYDTLQSIRLQKAANLLIVNKKEKVSMIAQQCGYSTHSAFIRAFRQRYALTPTQWREGGYLNFSKENIRYSDKVPRIASDFTGLKPAIVKMPAIRVAYIRHRGYNHSIAGVWQRLYAYAVEHGLEQARQIGLHHDNPSIVPLEECAYVAAIEIPDGFEVSGSVSSFVIPSSLCARFTMQGRYGEVPNLIRYIYHTWLPESGFEAKTLPPYVVYRRNHFLEADERFDLDFYLPVSVI